MQTAQLAELLEQELVMGKSKRLAFELQVVVAKRTVQVTSIGELEQSGKQVKSPPSSNDACFDFLITSSSSSAACI